MTISLMTPKKAAAYFVLAILSAAWFASALGVPQSSPARRTPAPSSDDARLDALARDVQAQSSRLRQRLASAPAVQSPARNPFSFGRREMPQRRAQSTSLAPDQPSEPVPDPAQREPLLVLIGVAEDNTPEGIVRTAMISEDGDDLHMAKQGQRVAGRYVVVTVSADAVELKDETTGATRRLALR